MVLTSMRLLTVFTWLSFKPCLSSKRYPFGWCTPGERYHVVCSDISDTRPWCNTTAARGERVSAFLANLSIAEKAVLLAKRGPAPIGSQTGPVDRLNYPLVHWWHEGLHGIWWPGWPGGTATSWPAVLGVAASFNRSLFYALGQLTGTEGRAMCGVQSDFWTPVLNLLREARWGRGQESPGEDPYLNSWYGVEFVRGLQGEDPRYLRVASTLKHFVGYDAPENNPSREGFNAEISQQDLADSYYPAFQSAIQLAKPAGLMCSYNALNGVPMCANPLMNNLVRHQWGMQGYVVSDCLAFDDIALKHNYTNSLHDAIGKAYGAGMDLYNCGQLKTSHLESFMKESSRNEAVLTKALRNLLEVQFRLGFFDPPSLNPYNKLTPSQDVDTPAWRALAKEAAIQSMVLLVNHHDRLPLKPAGKLALIGPHANSSKRMQGNYALSSAPYLVTPLEAFSKHLSNVVFSVGCGVNVNDTSGIAEAVAVARDAEDVVLLAGLSSVTIGNDRAVEAEELDRTSLLLPGVQDQLIQEVAAAATKPIVLVLLSGGAIDISAAMANPKVGAIMWAGYPGQSGGDAIAETVLGLQPPAGKLPMTWYFNNITERVRKTQMAMRPDAESGYPGRTYRFFKEPVLFEFGHGMTYTRFSYEVTAPDQVDLKTIHRQLLATRHTPHHAQSLVEVTVTVENSGSLASSTSVLLFLVPPGAGQSAMPLKQLRGFDGVPLLETGQKASVQFRLSAHDFAIANRDGQFTVRPGQWQLLVGDVMRSIQVGTAKEEVTSDQTWDIDFV